MTKEAGGDIIDTGADLRDLFPGESVILLALKVESDRFDEIAERHRALALEIATFERGASPHGDGRLDALEVELHGLIGELASMIAARKAE
ncbi:hypothetical protein [Sphingopyxis sp.]|uniref:hypothetical protein n=1 Tax=Sphingopyxis sp. TaxID=1908224 RepID=UPI003BA9DAE9